jgi:hypothetical protein
MPSSSMASSIFFDNLARCLARQAYWCETGAHVPHHCRIRLFCSVCGAKPSDLLSKQPAGDVCQRRKATRSAEPCLDLCSAPSRTADRAVTTGPGTAWSPTARSALICCSPVWRAGWRYSARSDAANGGEILVLHHDVAALRTEDPCPRVLNDGRVASTRSTHARPCRTDACAERVVEEAVERFSSGPYTAALDECDHVGGRGDSPEGAEHVSPSAAATECRAYYPDLLVAPCRS